LPKTCPWIMCRMPIWRARWCSRSGGRWSSGGRCMSGSCRRTRRSIHQIFAPIVGARMPSRRPLRCRQRRRQSRCQGPWNCSEDLMVSCFVHHSTIVPLEHRTDFVEGGWRPHHVDEGGLLLKALA
jgi:hypothetical protein